MTSIQKINIQTFKLDLGPLKDVARAEEKLRHLPERSIAAVHAEVDCRVDDATLAYERARRFAKDTNDSGVAGPSPGKRYTEGRVAQVKGAVQEVKGALQEALEHAPRPPIRV